MKTITGPIAANPSRLDQLSADFAALAPSLDEGPERQAFSLLHGMIQELRRSGGVKSNPAGEGDRALEDLLELYQRAPAMEGDAVCEPLPVGTIAPEFSLRDADGQEVALSSFRGRTLVIAFYPLDWSPGCSKQLDLYQQDMIEFERRDVALVGISVDSLYSHGAWATARGLTMPLLADFNPKGEVARRYGVWREADGFSERALYVVDHEGVIRHAEVSPKLQHVPDIYELFSVLDGLDARQTA